jgi:predicted nuclease with TOPRIM domain
VSVDRLADLEAGLTEFRTELQKFRLEASRDNADLARGIKEEFTRLYARIDRLEHGQAEILAILRRRRWWPF